MHPFASLSPLSPRPAAMAPHLPGGRRGAIAVLLALALLLTVSPAPAAESAQGWYRKGFRLQQEFRTVEALEAYRKALALDPFHARTHYEIGWTYWILERWEDVVRHWELALEAKVPVPELPDYLRMARERVGGKLEPLVRPAVGTRAEGPGLALTLVARFQHYDPQPASPADHFDRHVFSPKSVQIAPDGAKAYVQALEGRTTIVYDARTLAKRKAIVHAFDAADGALFDAAETAAYLPRFRAGGLSGPVTARTVNTYRGKPVEGVFTHGGRYLWVSHYRRDLDKLGVLPSSVAVIDTARDAIVRVMHTGPIPKFLAASPDGQWLAVVHWGDNTVGLIDVRGEDPAGFRHAGEIVVEERLALDRSRKLNRDRYCGFCLRGAVFTADSRHLLVARMGGGGIAVLDVAEGRHVGSVFGQRPTPRHLVLSGDRRTLYVGSNSSGYVAAYRTAAVVQAAYAGAEREQPPRLAPLREVRTGSGTRTIALSPDERWLFAAVNRGSRLVALDAATFERVVAIPVDSFPVGLAVHPDGSHVWVTSQGYKLRGGNAVTVYRIERRED